MPHLTIELSTALITRLFQTAISQRLPCPTDIAHRYTDVNIKEVIAFRGDDSTFSSILPSIEQDLNAYIPGATAIDQTFFIPGDSESGLIEVPAIFLLVSAELRVFADADLDVNKTLNIAGDPFKKTFERTAQLLSGTPPPPLLFSLTISPSVDGSSLTLKVNFISLFNPFALSSGNPDALYFTNLLRALASNIELSFQLPGILRDQNIPIFSANISTETWQGGFDGSGTRGIRIGVDFSVPGTLGAWKNFFSGNSWLATPGEDWSLHLSAEGLVDLTKAVARPHLAPQTDIHFGNSYRNPDISVSWNSPQLSLDVPVNDNNTDIQIGNASISFVISQGSIQMFGGGSIATVHFHLCSDFSIDPAFGFLVVFSGGTVIAAISGDNMGVLASIFGLLFGILATGPFDSKISSDGTDQVAGFIASGGLDKYCAAPDSNKCRDCDFQLDQYLPNAGPMRLQRVETGTDGLHLGGIINWENGRPDISPGKLEVTTPGDWTYQLSAVCESMSRNPRRNLILKNTGELPLTICTLVDLSNPQVLLFMLGNKPVITPFTIQPGAHLTILVIADLDRPVAFVPALPFNIRIISTGGAFEIDLALNGIPALLNQQIADAIASLGQLICNTLHERTFPWAIWKRITYTDPVPYREREQVWEQITIESSGILKDATMEVAGINGSKLASFPVVNGYRFLQFDIQRMPMGYNTTGMQIRNLTKANIDADKKNGPREKMIRKFERVLFHNVSTKLMSAPIIDYDLVENQKNQVIVLTGFELQIFAVKRGRLAMLESINLRGNNGVRSMGKYFIVSGAQGLFLLDENLNVLSQVKGSFTGLTISGDRIWATQEKTIQHFTVQGNNLKPVHTMRIAGVSDIESVGKSVFAVRGESVWRLSPGEPKNLKIPAYALIRKGKYLGAVGSRATLLINEPGNTIANYAVTPWSFRLLDFPDLHAALLFKNSEGRIILLDRNISLIDIPGHPELKEWMTKEIGWKQNWKAKKNLRRDK